MDNIIFDHVCFGYPHQEEILHNVSFTIRAGDFLAIIGPNGAGKSTLLKLLLRLLKPLQGSIIAPSAKYIAYVPQTIQLDRLFPITVEEVVLGGRIAFLSWTGRFSAEDRKIVSEQLAFVHLQHIANRRFGDLSLGQAQRVLLARALASHPSILLLDEPTSSSDPAAQALALDLLNSLKGSLTIIMVTHTIETILHTVDSVIMVHGGTAIMRPKEVCEHFAMGLYHKPLIEIPNDHFKQLFSL